MKQTCKPARFLTLLAVAATGLMLSSCGKTPPVEPTKPPVKFESFAITGVTSTNTTTDNNGLFTRTDNLTIAAKITLDDGSGKDSTATATLRSSVEVKAPSQAEVIMGDFNGDGIINDSDIPAPKLSLVSRQNLPPAPNIVRVSQYELEVAGGVRFPVETKADSTYIRAYGQNFGVPWPNWTVTYKGETSKLLPETVTEGGKTYVKVEMTYALEFKLGDKETLNRTCTYIRKYNQETYDPVIVANIKALADSTLTLVRTETIGGRTKLYVDGKINIELPRQSGAKTIVPYTRSQIFECWNYEYSEYASLLENVMERSTWNITYSGIGGIGTILGSYSEGIYEVKTKRVVFGPSFGDFDTPVLTQTERAYFTVSGKKFSIPSVEWSYIDYLASETLPAVPVSLYPKPGYTTYMTTLNFSVQAGNFPASTVSNKVYFQIAPEVVVSSTGENFVLTNIDATTAKSTFTFVETTNKGNVIRTPQEIILNRRIEAPTTLTANVPENTFTYASSAGVWGMIEGVNQSTRNGFTVNEQKRTYTISTDKGDLVWTFYWEEALNQAGIFFKCDYWGAISGESVNLQPYEGMSYDRYLTASFNVLYNGMSTPQTGLIHLSEPNTFDLALFTQFCKPTYTTTNQITVYDVCVFPYKKGAVLYYSGVKVGYVPWTEIKKPTQYNMAVLRRGTNPNFVYTAEGLKRSDADGGYLYVSQADLTTDEFFLSDAWLTRVGLSSIYIDYTITPNANSYSVVYNSISYVQYQRTIIVPRVYTE